MSTKETVTSELERLDMLCQYENELYSNGYDLIAGIDEVGRGPLAGPVVACCLVLPRASRISGINDSKKLSAKKREQLFPIIMSEALYVGLGIVEPAEIDAINILNATHKAMQIALNKLEHPPKAVIVDGRRIPGIPDSIFQKSVIKGDQLSITVAAASIIAKVTRDEMMLRFHTQYPDYGFDKHKGYGTAYHIEAIKKHGLTPIHRISFTRKLIRTV